MLSSEFKRVYAGFYRKALSEALEVFAEYEIECREHSRNGHRPKYCIHGTYQWTDYDNICMGCEDGLSTPEQFARMRAIENTQYYVKMVKEVSEFKNFDSLSYQQNSDVRRMMVDNIVEFMSKNWAGRSKKLALV